LHKLSLIAQKFCGIISKLSKNFYNIEKEERNHEKI